MAALKYIESCIKIKNSNKYLNNIIFSKCTLQSFHDEPFVRWFDLWRLFSPSSDSVWFVCRCDRFLCNVTSFFRPTACYTISLVIKFSRFQTYYFLLRMVSIIKIFGFWFLRGFCYGLMVGFGFLFDCNKVYWVLNQQYYCTLFHKTFYFLLCFCSCNLELPDRAVYGELILFFGGVGHSFLGRGAIDSLWLSIWCFHQLEF